MSSNALATGRRTYLHESAALDFAIRACEALGLVFWALAPGTDIWATDYSQNTFRVHVGKSANGTRVVTGNGRRAYVAVGERRTVAQADQWSLFSIEGEAQDVADTADIAVETVAPVADTVESLDASSVAVANGYTAEYVRLLDDDIATARTDIERRRLEALRAIATTPVAPTESLEVAAKRMYAVHDQLAELGKGDAGYLVARAMNADSNHFYDQAQARRAGQYVATISDGRKPAQAATVAPVADTADTAPVGHATAVVAESGKGGKVWRAHCTCGHRSATYVAEHAAETMADSHLRDVGAPVVITDAHGRTDFTRKVAHALREYDDAAMYGNGDARIAWTHKVLTILAGEYVASVPEYAALAELDDAYRAAETGYCAGLVKWSEYVATVRNLRDRAVIAGHERLLDSIDAWAMTLDIESPELAPVLGGEKVSDAPFVADTAPLVAHAAQVVTLAPHRFQSQCDCGWKSATAILASTAKYAAATHVASADRAPFAAGDPVAVRGEGVCGGDAHGTVTACDGNVSVSLEDGASVYVAASDVTPRVSDAAAAELRAHRAADDVSPRVMGITGTGVAIRDRESGKEYGFHAACWASFADAVGPTARLVEVGPLFGDDWTCTQCLDAPASRWSTDGNRAYATMVGDFGHALATLTPYRDRYELAIEYAATGNRDVFPVHAGDVHAAIAEAERRVLREAVEASSNDVPAETEFAARVRTARTPKVPGIHVARCYRCGERACETLRLPVSSLTNVCSEHVTEARAVALRWDAASRYMHEEAPGALASNGQLAVIFTREATNRLDVPLPVIARAVLDADARSQHGVGLTDRAHRGDDRDSILARELDAFTAARGTAPSNPVVGK